jgi:S1-C subfamily serine protease/Tfp pilus assembly protein PilF
MSSAGRVLVPLFLLLAAALVAGPSLHVEREPCSPAALYQHTLPAIGWVHAPDQGKGTGFVIDRSRRWLLTNYHVVGETKTVEIFFPVKDGDRIVGDRGTYLEKRPQLENDGYVVRGKVLRRSAEADLALVELASLPPGVTELYLADESAEPGDRVYLVGNRYDCEPLWVHTAGAVRQVLVWKEGYFNGGKQLAKGVRVVLTQAPINEGDSGAPAVNERGAVIGVAAAVAWEYQGCGLLIDVSEVRRFLGGKVGEGIKVDPPAPMAAHLAPREIYRQGLRSFALVQTAAGEKRASGWIVDRQRRLLLTTADAVGKYDKADATFPLLQNDAVVAEYAFYRDQQPLLKKKGQRVTGAVLAVDARRNLALVELPSLPDDVTAARVARETASPGDPLHVLSNPQRLESLWIYGAGSVRQLGHVNLGQTPDGPDPGVVIVQVPLGEGDGGGLVLDGHGDVVGMISGKVGPQQQVAFCLTAAEIQGFLDDQRPRWDPRNAAELCARGRLFVKARQLDRALQDFTEAVQSEPKCADAYSERGNVYRLQGKLDSALAECDRAVQLDAKLVTAYCHRAEVWLAKGETAGAVADCDAALKRDEKCALAYCIRADARRLLGDFDRALADCDEAVWHDRRLPAAHLVKGRILVQKDDLPAAVGAFTAALQLDPQLTEGYRLRADAHWARSDVSAAFVDYTEALKLQSDDANSLHGRGRCQAARGDHDSALRDFNAALRLDANLWAAQVDRGNEYLRRGDLDKAFTDFTIALGHQSGLVEHVFAVIERRAAELSKDDKDDPEKVCTLCRRGLEVIRPVLKTRTDVQQGLDAALVAAEAEKDVRKRASFLQETIAALRNKLAARAAK